MTSQKHADFVRETMKEKSIGDIAGINGDVEKIFCDKGFNKAYQLLGQYLVFNKNDVIFEEFLKSIFQELKTSDDIKIKRINEIMCCLKIYILNNF